MKQLKWIIAIGLCFITILGNSQNQALFEQGKTQYKADNFQEAINQWKKIIANGEHSAEVYFNLGNAYYKLHQMGPSIYYYEKALQLAPNDSDVKNNLAFARNATIDVIEPLPKTFFAKWDQNISSLMPYDSWAWVAVIGILLFALLFLKYYFSEGTRTKRLFFVSSLLVLFIGITAFAMAFKTFHKATNVREAIVFAESAEVKNGAGMKNETIFQLHEGTKVEIMAEEDDWLHIYLADGKDGWMPASEVKEL